MIPKVLLRNGKEERCFDFALRRLFFLALLSNVSRTCLVHFQLKISWESSLAVNKTLVCVLAFNRGH